MKLLKVSFDHLKMFENGLLTIDFYAQDKVPASDDSVFELQRPLYSNNVLAFAGINASGKTTVLNLIELACRIVDGGPANQQGLPVSLPDVFDGESCFRGAVYHDGFVYLVCSDMIVRSEGILGNQQASLIFADEAVLSIPVQRLKKTMLTDWDTLFSIASPVAKRLDFGDIWQGPGLEDISVFSAASRRGSARSRLVATRSDGSMRLREGFDGLDDILRVFDPGISHLAVEDSGRAFSLSFEGRDPIILSLSGLEEVLSSGTVRGFSLVQSALRALGSGGYLLVDEVENHLNRQLVNVIIDLFTSRKTNPRGATIVFTSHYAQLLDHIHRKDNVYFLLREERGASKVAKYSDKVRRIENKKSEVFASNYVRGTAPRYADVRKLQDLVARAVDSDE